MSVRVRFAPSPTGYMHVGNVRTVVFNWLFAQQNHGVMVLRIEDTDRTRYVPDAVRVIADNLRWLGITWQEGPDIGGPFGPYVQSERLDLYRNLAEELINSGYAYRCNCPPERLDEVRTHLRAEGEMPMYDGHCRNKAPGEVSVQEPHVIRLKVPREGSTTFRDELRGEITIENRLIDDQILLKSDGFPTYHLAVVIDDHMMQITHIIRGDDWIPSTPKRILIYQAFGWTPPTYIHVPLVLGPDGKKLSKRHGAVAVDEFRREGYLPEAMINFLALLGWAPGEGEEQEVFSVDELIRRFDLNHINRAPAVFSYDKLNWLNGYYIRSLSQDDLLARLIPFWAEAGYVPDPVPAELLHKLRLIVPLVQERLKTLKDVVDLTAFMFTEIGAVPVEMLIGNKMTLEQSLQALQATRKLLAGLVDFSAEAMEPPMRSLAEQLGLKAGQLFGIVRNAVTGRTVTPPLFGTLAAIGRETVLRRLVAAETTLLASSQTVSET